MGLPRADTAEIDASRAKPLGTSRAKSLAGGSGGAAPVGARSGVIAAADDAFRLQVVRGIDRGRMLELGTFRRVRIGSHPSNELCLLDRHVSRFHCELVASEQGWVLRDLDSTNGTYVDRQPIKQLELSPGARLRVGHTVLEVTRYEGGDARHGDPMVRFGRMVGGSPGMARVFQALQRVASSPASCLLLGEVGTGKALAARAVHEHSPRREGPFLVVDCGAVSPQFMEDKLFGHQRGKFTGEDAGAPGVFEEAAGGTVFLDQLGELPLALQPRLLQVLERRETTRIGSSEPVPLDVRVVAATHRNLMSMVRAGQFRQDLLYRVSEVTIRIPALRERKEDIGTMGRVLLEEEGFDASLTDEAVAFLEQRSWPGNIQELRNFLRRAAMLIPGSVIERSVLEMGDASDLTTMTQPGLDSIPPSEIELPEVTNGEGESSAEIEKPRSHQPGFAPETSLEMPLETATEDFRRAYVRELRARFGDDLQAAAAHAGIHPKSVSRLFRQYDVY